MVPAEYGVMLLSFKKLWCFWCKYHIISEGNGHFVISARTDPVVYLFLPQEGTLFANKAHVAALKLLCSLKRVLEA